MSNLKWFLNETPRACCDVCGYPLANGQDEERADSEWEEGAGSPEWTRTLCWSQCGCAHMGGYSKEKYAASRRHLS